MEYGNPHSRVNGLPFRSDGDYLATLEEKRHAFEKLREAVELCEDQDMRTNEVYEALDYLRTKLKRFGSINGFSDGLNIQHPKQRKLTLQHHLVAIEGSL